MAKRPAKAPKSKKAAKPASAAEDTSEKRTTLKGEVERARKVLIDADIEVEQIVPILARTFPAKKGDKKDKGDRKDSLGRGDHKDGATNPADGVGDRDFADA